MRTVVGACHHDCPDSCGWIATVEETPSGPRATKLRGNPDHPYSHGELCPKVNRFLDRTYSPERISVPLRRTGLKGSGQFSPVSWDEALHEISTRWKAIIDANGAEAIVPFWDAGNQSLLAMHAHERFVSRVGMTRLVDSVCGLGAAVGTALTYGSARAADPTELRYAKCIVLWGTNTRLTNRHLWPVIEQARTDGATVIVIDPLRTRTVDSADTFVQPLPGTDAALMLGLIHLWVRDDRVDHDYVATHADGYDTLCHEATTWTPERVAETCGLTVSEILLLADVIASNAPAHFRTLIGAEHREQGGTFFQLLTALPILLGSWRHRGGGYSRSVGTYTSQALASLSITTNGSKSSTRSFSMNHIGKWLTDVHEVPVESLLVWNANPLVTMPNAELIRRGLLRDDLFTVVHDQFLTDTASYADIVLPATTQLESDDVVPSWGSLHLNWNGAAIPPLGESVSNSELFRRLAAAMGFDDDPDLQASDDELLERAFWSSDPLLEGITLDRLRAEKTIRLTVPDDFRPYAEGNFATPSGKAQLTHRGKAPTFVASTEGPGGPRSDRFPLSLMSPKHHQRFLNSSYSHLSSHNGAEGTPFVELCAEDARSRDIQTGDIVEVRNDRATLRLVARIGTSVRPGVVSVPFGWTASAHMDGKTVNALTNDTISNVGAGVAFSDTMVEVAKV